MTGPAPTNDGVPTEASDKGPKPAPGNATPSVGVSRLWLLLAVLVAAQLLVFHHVPGSGLATFLALLLGLVTLKYRQRPAWILGGTALAAVASVAEYADIFSVPLAVVLVVFYAFDRAGGLPENDLLKWRRLGRFLAVEPLRSVPEIFVSLSLAERRFTTTAGRSDRVRQWGLPIALAAVFLALFLPANPWLALSLHILNPSRWISLPGPFTMLMWLLVGLAAWPLLGLETTRSGARPQRVRPAKGGFLLGSLIDADVAVLFLFNGIFLLQTSADLVNLWPAVLSGVRAAALLPEGMSYADFAKAGAYPLSVAAILAAGLILVVLREDQRQSRGARLLILAWIVQTLLLLGSAAIRLDLYVDAYGLTRLRLYTFIGMGLIAAGLALTIWRVARTMTNAWLTRQNLRVAMAAVFVCGATNLDGVIADNNVTRTLTVTEGSYSRSIDRHYLCQLGEGALPAMAEIFREGTLPLQQRLDLQKCHARLRSELAARQSDWRSWTWRGSRLLNQSQMTVAIQGWEYR